MVGTIPTRPIVIHSNPDILGGTPVFVGTKVPVKTLIDYLEAGDSIDLFLDHFPSVSRIAAVSVLVAQRNRLPDLIPLVPGVCEARNSISPGEVVEVS